MVATRQRKRQGWRSAAERQEKKLLSRELCYVLFSFLVLICVSVSSARGVKVMRKFGRRCGEAELIAMAKRDTRDLGSHQFDNLYEKFFRLLYWVCGVGSEIFLGCGDKFIHLKELSK